MEYPFQPNSLYYGDCLEVLAQWPDACVELIYLDPPFNSKTNYNILFGSDRKSGGGGRTQVLAFQDTWFWNKRPDNASHELNPRQHTGWRCLPRAGTDPGRERDAGLPQLHGAALDPMPARLERHGQYLFALRPDSQSLFENVLDAVFGAKNFRNEIVWCYTGSINTESVGFLANMTQFFSIEWISNEKWTLTKMTTVFRTIPYIQWGYGTAYQGRCKSL